MDEPKDKFSPIAIGIFALLHVLCCGLPLLLLAGVSFEFVSPAWPIAGFMLIFLGMGGVIWYVKRGCATYPRNEGNASCSIKSK